MSDHDQSAARHDPVLAVILSDFGRDAALRFAAELARAERSAVAARLPPGAPFLDEDRLLTLALVGDLPFAKERFLAPYRASGRPLDDRVLVGFEGGPAPADVEIPLAALALEAMRGPVERGRRQVAVLLPCNTLAPVSWALRDRFDDPVGLSAALEDAGLPRGLVRFAAEQLPRIRLTFPTVPGLVIREALEDGAGHLLPLGTRDIAHTYRAAIRRAGAPLEVVDLDDDDRGVVLEAIGAAIEGCTARRRAADVALRALVERARRRHREITAVEACTDLDYGVGLDSTLVYARGVVRDVYAS